MARLLLSPEANVMCLDPDGRMTRMPIPLRASAALLLLLAAPSSARAQAPPPSDPVLSELIEQSLAARPELRQAQEQVHAERQRIPQAGALPDPVLSLGIQNDGFDSIQVGKMETSFYQIMLSQGVPWPGKRGLRTDVARLAADAVEAGVARIRLSTEASVRRAYLDLLLARDRLALLDELEALWHKSAAIALTRYEAGDGAQSDVLRAQLELNRLRQRRWALQAQERSSVQALNRLRASPLDQPVATRIGVRDLGAPALPELELAIADAAARSPELAQARLEAARADKQAALARRERFPDLSVNAGVMPRGGLEPMWLAGIAFNLPVWSGRKQGRAVEETRARAAAGTFGVEALEQALHLRVAERRTALASLLDTVRLYSDGLLLQSQMTVESTLAQYRVGKVTFASVLDANAGYIGDKEGYLAALAEAQRIAIAGAEVSVNLIGASLAGGGMGGSPIPGAGAAGGGAAAAAGGAPAQASAGAAPSMSSGM